MKKVYGIGIGPGDKELITLKAYNLIRNCNCIFAPKGKGKSRAKEIVSQYIQEKEVIELDFPMGEDNSLRYAQAAKRIDRIVSDGQTAVFLTLGDAMVYSTYIYLMDELQKLDIQVETVPGIASFGAAASILNMPIAVKGESFYLGDRQVDDEILKRVDSICLLKVNQTKEKIIAKLENHGFRYVYVKRCTQPEQKILCDKEAILQDDDYMSLLFARKG